MMISISRRVVAAAITLLVLLIIWYRRDARYRLGSALDNIAADWTDRSPGSGRLPFYPGTVKPPGSNYSKILVIPKLKSEHIGWIEKELPGLNTAVYEVDNPSASLRVPKNKGHEAMVYLTYIIDHYDHLPDTVVFAHAHRKAWHNNFLLDLDTAITIKRLRDERVARQGYMNLRCHLDPGCPNWIHVDRAKVDFDDFRKPEEQRFSPELFQSMFPGHRPPPVLSQPCCAQFAVSSERIRDNSKKLYEHLRNWLLDTHLEDKDSGRIFEYMWQYLFTRNAEHCPAMNSCYCDGYGICFGSAAKLDEWLKKLKVREAVDAELDEAHKQRKDKSAIDEISQRQWTLNQELRAEKDEAYRRGDDEKNRAMERERTWTDQ
ncbi:hypothetical protein EJ04DRAFT_514865 [Polyplosphaeria fusca]|uniref:Uncharacterized protein n=1 Tax=Polyplosphaeria fusca TaxID=682080 RepID=A0A9P4QU59_9PLEO|nr:hypothetical protein EJ04DRAFT_514865 [Polyplosphaeria fusca]